MNESLEKLIAEVTRVIKAEKMFGTETEEGDASLYCLVDALDVLDVASIDKLLEFAIKETADAKALAVENTKLSQRIAEDIEDSLVQEGFDYSNRPQVYGQPPPSDQEIIDAVIKVRSAESGAFNSTQKPVTRLSGLDLERVDYRRAETKEDREAVYRLRYRAYLHEGVIEPNRDGRTTDRFDEMSNCWIFGVYFDGKLASSIRISVASPNNPVSPSVAVFPDLLMEELAQGKIIVDPTRFVADPERANRIPELPYMTLRLAYIACSYFSADIGLASVRAEHQAFYRRVFQHMPLSPPRQYPGLNKPICLMAMHYPSMHDKVFARYPFLRSSCFERRMLFERGVGCRALRINEPELSIEKLMCFGDRERAFAKQR